MVRSGRRGILLATVGLALPARWAAAQSAEVQRRFVGRALDVKSGNLLYTEEHRQTVRDGRWWAGTIRYVSPSGDVLAEKALDFSQDRYIPLMRTIYRQTGYEERITRVDAGSVTMETLREGKSTIRQVQRAPLMAADSGFHAFIQAQLDELVAGNTVQLNFGVIAQHSSFKFRIRRTGLQAGGEQQRLQLVAEPDSLLRMLIDPLRLVYDARSRDLLEYEGLSNITDPQTGKPARVRIVYEFPAS